MLLQSVLERAEAGEAVVERRKADASHDYGAQLDAEHAPAEDPLDGAQGRHVGGGSCGSSHSERSESTGP